MQFAFFETSMNFVKIFDTRFGWNLYLFHPQVLRKIKLNSVVFVPYINIICEHPIDSIHCMHLYLLKPYIHTVSNIIP